MEDGLARASRARATGRLDHVHPPLLLRREGGELLDALVQLAHVLSQVAVGGPSAAVNTTMSLPALSPALAPSRRATRAWFAVT